MDHSVVMAVGGKVSFNSWLSSYLSERSIDVDVYLEYICGITHTSGEGDEEELVSSLEEVLSGAVVSYSFSFRYCFMHILCIYVDTYIVRGNLSMYVRTYIDLCCPPPQTYTCTFMEDL